MKKALIILFVFCFLGFSAYAKQKQQEAEKPLLTADDIVAKLTFQLGLSDDQAKQIKPIIQNYLDQEKALKVEEASQLRKVLTGQQMYSWNFLQTEPSKKRGRSLF